MQPLYCWVLPWAHGGCSEFLGSQGLFFFFWGGGTVFFTYCFLFMNKLKEVPDGSGGSWVAVAPAAAKSL